MKPALSTDLIQVIRYVTTVEPDRREVLVTRSVRFRYRRSGRVNLVLTASLLVNAALAAITKHHTTQQYLDAVAMMPANVSVLAIHIKPRYYTEVCQEIRH